MSGVSTAVIWALPEIADESALVAAAPAAGLRIVRRCVDAADLLAHASVDVLTTIVVSDGVPRLDADLARRLTAGGRHVVGVATSATGLRRLHDWGVTSVVDIGDTEDCAADVVACIAAACHDATARITRDTSHSPVAAGPLTTAPSRPMDEAAIQSEPSGSPTLLDATSRGVFGVRDVPIAASRSLRDRTAGADADGSTTPALLDDPSTRRSAAPAARRARDEGGERSVFRSLAVRWSKAPSSRLFGRARADASATSPSSRVVAIVAPPGAPGCSTTAIGVADELARTGRRVLLVDADVRSPSHALMLGVTDETSGLLLAARQADNGLLTPRTLVQIARAYRDGLDVLTGLPRPDRRGELRSSALERIWQCARDTYDVTVIDVGAADLTVPDERSLLADDPVDACAQSGVRAADDVIVVARGDVIGMSRLSIASARLSAATALAIVDPPRHATAHAARLAADLGMRVPVECVRWDDAWSDALVRGATLAEVKPRSRTRHAYQSLANRIVTTALQDAPHNLAA